MTLEELRAAYHSAEELCDMLEDTPDLYQKATALRLELLSRCMDAELSNLEAWQARRPIDATGNRFPVIYDGATGKYEKVPS